MFLACIMFVINKYLSNESILAWPISLVPFSQSCRKLLSQMYSKLEELGIPCLLRLIFPEFSSLGWLYYIQRRQRQFSGLFMAIYLPLNAYYFGQWRQTALLMSSVALKIRALLFLTKPKCPLFSAIPKV